MFPIKLARYDPIPSFQSTNLILLKEQIQTLLPNSLKDKKIQILDLSPRIKDGGLFVQFSLNLNHITLNELVSEINHKLANQSIFRSSSIFSYFGRGRAFKVRGLIFNEDIASLVPSTRIKVETSGDIPLVCIFNPPMT
jgi:hypothetical protein